MAPSLAQSPTPDIEADQIRQRMRAIRRDLGADVEDLVGHAERLMDWRYCVQRNPWVSMGIAAFVGYFMVPGRLVAFPTDDTALRKLADRIPVTVQPPPPEPKASLFGSLVSLGLNTAGRAALAFAGQQVGKFIGQQAAQFAPPQTEETTHGKSTR